MNGRLFVGTVRAVRDGRHLVISRDGTPIDVLFDGDDHPKIGGDVVGILRTDEDGNFRMSLGRSVADTLMTGNHRIVFSRNQTELTARTLARLLSRSESAVIAPGRGLSIERSPGTDDPDLDWAVSFFRSEADRLAIALNVIDVQAVSRAPWNSVALHDKTLPADIEGNGRAMHDLVRLLKSGFHPDCNRLIETISGMHEISVNFVLPYSPFAGALGFCREVSGMDRGHFPMTAMSMSDARRISSAKHIALAFAHAKLGAGAQRQAHVQQSRRTVHVANCFADAAAVMAFVASGGSIRSAEAYGDLKESSLYYGNKPGTKALRSGILEEATQRAIRAALDPLVLDRVSSARDVLTEAVRIARRVALPAMRFHGDEDFPTEMEWLSARGAAERVAVDLRSASRERANELATFYRDEVRDLVSQHDANDLAASRLIAFGGFHIPHRLENVFDEETQHIRRALTMPFESNEADKRRKPTIQRIRRSSAAIAEDDKLEFEMPMTP